jgi:hypothetical protein
MLEPSLDGRHRTAAKPPHPPHAVSRRRFSVALRVQRTFKRMFGFNPVELAAARS